MITRYDDLKKLLWERILVEGLPVLMSRGAADGSVDYFIDTDESIKSSGYATPVSHPLDLPLVELAYFLEQGVRPADPDYEWLREELKKEVW